MKTNCYYEDFNTCTNQYSEFCENACPGKGTCSRYISGDEYFEKLMNGELREEKPTVEDVKVRDARIKSKLSLGKTKKQIKYEQRREDERNGITRDGFTLGDDPRFKDLFKKK